MMSCWNKWSVLKVMVGVMLVPSHALSVGLLVSPGTHNLQTLTPLSLLTSKRSYMVLDSLVAILVD